MRLLVVSHSCVVDVNQRIYAALADRGHQVAIVVPARWRHDYARRPTQPQLLRSFTGPLIRVRVARVGSIPLHWYTQRLRPIVRRWRPNAIFIEEEPYSVSAFQWARVARLEHTPYAFFSLQNIAKHYPPPFTQTRRYVYDNSPIAAALTQDVRDTLRRTGFRGTIEILPLSVDVSAFSPSADHHEARERIGITPPVVGFLGRLVPEKGVDVLLESFTSVRAATGASLLCIGSGPMADLCRSTDGVIVADGVRHSDVPGYLGALDVLVLPSRTTSGWKEQFGRALVEALACGIPVIGSDSGEIPHLIRETGGGLVVREGDPADLSEALLRLLRDDGLARSLGQRGREAVCERYSLEAVSGRMENVLQRLIQRAPDR